MRHRIAAAVVAASLLGVSCAPAWADNQMGYQLLTMQQASALPRAGGSLGMTIGQGQAINDSSGLSFEMLKVNGVNRGSPGAQAGFKTGDQIIAVDGHVFPSVNSFAAYVGSIPPGRPMSVDYIPNGGGPQQATRTTVTVGGPNGRAAAPATQESSGMSTGTKLAIGAGAVALFGCYELGCFNRSRSAAPNSQGYAQPR